MQRKSNSVFDKLSVFNEEGELNVIVDTPKGSRNKYKFDEDLGLFRLGGVLAVGHFFPFDFGYVPNTLGGDGDPLDVLILMDEPAFAGCLIPSRLIGVIEARQTEDGKTEANHRLIAVAANARAHTDVKSLNDLNKTLVDEIEHFFVSYNEAKGKKFEATARAGAQRAKNIIEEGISLREQSGKTKDKPRKK